MFFPLLVEHGLPIDVECLGGLGCDVSVERVESRKEQNSNFFGLL